MALTGLTLISKSIRVAREINLRLAKTEEQCTSETGNRVSFRYEASGGWPDLQQNSGLLPQGNLNLGEFKFEASVHHLTPKWNLNLRPIWGRGAEPRERLILEIILGALFKLNLRLHTSFMFPFAKLIWVVFLVILHEELCRYYGAL